MPYQTRKVKLFSPIYALTIEKFSAKEKIYET
jgi:hypothetical protein